MAYQVIARKWRPQTFDDVIGQGPVSQTLKNALSAGRVVHAYLFSGPRGIGKTSMARILSKALNCEKGMGPSPCNVCPTCQEITRGACLDVIEIDAASNRGIDDIRDISEKVKYAPAKSRYKIYILDEAHMLTEQAFNAFLKTLEEPPAHLVFIMATTAPEQFPATILSRCQRHDFRRIPGDLIRAQLAKICASEKIMVEDDAMLLLSANAEGCLRDAESILDQMVAYCGDRITLDDVMKVLGISGPEFLRRFTDTIPERDTAGMLRMIRELSDQGKDQEHFLRQWAEYLRHLLLILTVPGYESSIQSPQAHVALMKEQSGRFTPAALTRLIEEVYRADAQMGRAGYPQVLLEVLAVRLTQGHWVSLGEVMERLEGMPAAPTEAEPPQRVNSLPPVQKKTPELKTAEPADDPDATLAVSGIDDAPDAPGPLTLGRLQGVWPEAIEQVRKVNRALHAILLDSPPLKYLGNTLVLGAGTTFHRSQVESADNRRVLEEVLSQIVRQPVRVAAEVLPQTVPVRSPVGSGPAAEEVPAPASGPRKTDVFEVLQQEPVTKKFLDAFSGQVVTIVRPHKEGGPNP